MKGSLKASLSKQNEQRVLVQAEGWRHRQIMDVIQPSKLPYITISREYGCEGFNLGEALAVRLNRQLKPDIPWAVYDRALLEKIQNQHEIAADLVQSVCDKVQDAITDDLSNILAGKPSQLSVVRRMAQTIQMLAYQGNTIMVGRGSAIITRGIADGLHVRIAAPLKWRIERTQEREHLSSIKAAQHVKQMDRERDAFVKKYFKTEPYKFHLYDLVLNNAHWECDQMADLLVQAMTLKKYI